MVEHCFWEAGAVGSNPITPIVYIIQPLLNFMEIYTVEEFQDRWEEMIERVELGEHIGIVNDDGQAAVMMSTDDEMYKLYTEHDEAS